MTLQDFLQEQMRRYGWNRAQLAKHIGVDPNYVTRWLGGDAPRPPACQMIARAFDLPDEQVLKMAGHIAGEVGDVQPRAIEDPGLEAILAEVRGILKPRKERQRRGILEMVRVFDRYNANFPVRAL